MKSPRPTSKKLAKQQHFKQQLTELTQLIKTIKKSARNIKQKKSQQQFLQNLSLLKKIIQELLHNIKFQSKQTAATNKNLKKQLMAADNQTTLFQQFLQSSEHVFWRTSSNNKKIIYVSPGYEKIWGRSIKNLYQNPTGWMAAIIAEDRQKAVQLFAQLEKKKLPHISMTYRMMRPDKTLRYILDHAFLMKDGSGAVGIATDITDYLQIEKRNTVEQNITPELILKISKKTLLENELHRALINKEFTLYYQIKVDVQTKKIVGVEALLRWLRKDDNNKVVLVSPIEFIDLAEETGLIIAIGEWALRQACQQNKAWQDAGLPPIHVAVNISLKQFLLSNMVESIKKILDETNLTAEHLHLEITESLFIKEENELMNIILTLLNLQKLGIKIALDDFGTGFSSLNYLKLFRVDHIKIAQSFINGIPHNQYDLTITKAIIALAHGLQIEVVAEGVETAEQYDFLVANNCDQIQGFYFCPPLPPEEIIPYLKKKKLTPPNKN